MVEGIGPPCAKIDRRETAAKMAIRHCRETKGRRTFVLQTGAIPRRGEGGAQPAGSRLARRCSEERRGGRRTPAHGLASMNRRSADAVPDDDLAEFPQMHRSPKRSPYPAAGFSLVLGKRYHDPQGNWLAFPTTNRRIKRGTVLRC